MSEFANYDGFLRLIGTATENGLLTDAVRQRPFSVILLDEIEKSHTNVFDLCLQLFDAGRLTDGRGRTVDFRRTIIILTSNVGASAAGLVGFGTGESAADARQDKETFPRELARFFRPEFLNRLDRVIQFQPLSLETAEQIARREIQSVLQRSGIRRRQLVVDIDPGVLSLVLRQGYSPLFGARPLKRTVERLLLLPLAKAIASGSLNGKTILRLTEQSGRVHANAAPAPALRDSRSEQADPLPSRRTDRVAILRNRWNALETAAQELAERKSELLMQTRDPAFFRSAEVRASVLNEIHNLDQFLALCEETGKAVKTAGDRNSGSGPKNGDASNDEKIDRLESELDYLDLVARCRDGRDLGDAIVTLALLNRSGHKQDAVTKLAGMYASVAARRRMTAEVIGEIHDGPHDRAHLLVSGLGAFGLLKNEAGLHQVDKRYKQRSSGSNRELLLDDQEIVRVDVRPAGNELSKQFQQQVKSRLSSLKPRRNRLISAEFSVSLLHQPSLRSSEFWTAGPKEAALARGLMVLAAEVDSGPEASSGVEVIRIYDLGLGPKVRDTRTGRETTRVKQVLKGEVVFS
jgi:ATP-dependent Clp protease ATP-binding subunit ClpC